MVNPWDCSLWFNSKFNLNVACPKSFDPLFIPHLFTLQRNLWYQQRLSLIKTLLLSISILGGLKFSFLFLFRKTLSASFVLRIWLWFCLAGDITLSSLDLYIYTSNLFSQFTYLCFISGIRNPHNFYTFTLGRLFISPTLFF